jgi:riboflavin kinase/FMN adenylyltransferase
MKIGLNDGFGIHVLEPYKVRGQVVSSTLIRDFIEQGQIDRCLAFMGRYYCLKGIVIPGNRIGRTMGFPTSNVSLDEEMVAPANGVYISYCSYESVRFPSVTNVGHRPTVVKPGMGKNMETHIFNFDTDIYGKQIRVHFLERIRDEMRFPNIDELIAQIRQDCLTAASYHGIINRP